MASSSSYLKALVFIRTPPCQISPNLLPPVVVVVFPSQIIQPMASSSSASPRTGTGVPVIDSPAPAAGEAYEDLLPVMGEKLGTAGLLSELRAGFRLLADPARGGITPESLRRGAAAALGVDGMTAGEADAMVREGDHDGDGVLSEAEFCVLMVRLSPGIMEDAEAWLEEAIADELAMLEQEEQQEDPAQPPIADDDATGSG